MTLSRQRVVVLALTALVLAFFLPAATQGWQPRASFGMRILRAENVVREIRPGMAAEAAGVAVGDRIDVAALGVAGHIRLMYPRAGEQLTFSVQHPGAAARTLTLTAQPLVLAEPLRWLTVGAFLSTAAFIVVGATLVFLRASPMTWSLWLYCVGIVPVNDLLQYYSFLPEHVFAALWLFARTFLGGFSVFPLLPFALRFPAGHIGGWRVRIRPWSITLAAIAFAYYATLAWLGLRYGVPRYSLLNGLPALACYFIAGTLIAATYVRALGLERQRLKWAVTGMLVAFAAQLLEYIPGPAWVAPLAELCSIVMPICVAYAVLRHHLIDVQFVINRAIVYAGLTAFLLAFVSLLDWFTSVFISEYHLAKYLEAAATIAMGFVLDRVHKRLEQVTDRIFFRARHEAELQLARVGRSLNFATRIESIEEALVDEPVRCLGLASAALFRRDDDSGTFVRGRSIGWSADHVAAFPDDAVPARYVHADRTHLTARDVAWDEAALPGGVAAPALFVPIFAREDLLAIAIYGAHANGVVLDPDEVAVLAALAPGAGSAFDHLAFEDMRRQLADVTRRLRPTLPPAPVR